MNWGNTVVLAIAMKNDYACRAGRVCDAASRERTTSGGPRLHLAVGFDADGAWMSVQYGALAVAKHNSITAQKTTIGLQLEDDRVTLRVGHDGLLVIRGCSTVSVEDGGGIAAARDLLATSPAVSAARAMGRELGAEHRHGPEVSLASALAFVAYLGRDGASVDGLATARSRFLLRESAWLHGLVALQPDGHEARVRPTQTFRGSSVSAAPPARVSDWIARAARSDREWATARSHVRAGHRATRSVARVPNC